MRVIEFAAAAARVRRGANPLAQLTRPLLHDRIRIGVTADGGVHRLLPRRNWLRPGALTLKEYDAAAALVGISVPQPGVRHRIGRLRGPMKMGVTMAAESRKRRKGRGR